uniref:Succinate dehydrogenase cytochrome B subunit, mitochondrial n=1 Tax=Lygus hesperus TaxID=30085 RepID=A0A0A9X0W9_LYGHE
MAYLRSLCQASRMGLALKKQPFQASLIQTRMVTLKAVPAPPPTTANFEERNIGLGRPMSPHLLIYRPQLTSMMSISHRITGLALTFYAFVLGTSSLMGVDAAAAIANLGLPGAIAFVGKFIIAFPFSYHLVNGIRHLTWDYGLGLTIKEVYLTGYVTLALATLLTLLLASKKTEKKQ